MKKISREHQTIPWEACLLYQIFIISLIILSHSRKLFISAVFDYLLFVLFKILVISVSAKLCYQLMIIIHKLSRKFITISVIQIKKIIMILSLTLSVKVKQVKKHCGIKIYFQILMAKVFCCFITHHINMI